MMDPSFDTIFTLLETATRLDESKTNRIEAATKVRPKIKPNLYHTLLWFFRMRLDSSWNLILICLRPLFMFFSTIHTVL